MGKENEGTNGPHAWGNGPKPYGIVKRILTALKEKKDKGG